MIPAIPIARILLAIIRRAFRRRGQRFAAVHHRRCGGGVVGVRAFAIHPGMIATELGRHLTADDMTLLGFHTWLEHEAKALREMTEIETKDKEERHGR